MIKGGEGKGMGSLGTVFAGDDDCYFLKVFLFYYFNILI